MATLAFDSLRYARRLKSAGVPESQAEVQAELMAEAFGFYADNIVTRDYLDATLRATFAEQDAKLEQRFTTIDQRFVDIGAQLETALNSRLNQQDIKLASIEATTSGNFRVLSALMGVILLAVAVPALQSLF
ncbi:hypothetical protein CWI75_12215 [Kineobactrum sediminis]|uniref:DUF1640 domain-containing protein n=1 Tax=Kineobactrum sediminis TaxID=1905677 RepID=A0A2N5Y294_9GAMM|nr:hypothetical protein [Kineobactrum sediminis]PLW82508.1 hypothetical protein CWI75_12215 [Kineobactrum sediminis]